ncbi:ABC transporter substrate-binding protein [Motiliproteus sp. MSK22-1]|uniref:substrate-binding periplasmic protein n=1 Tax=Motiliproteus sp. MSK22-1 TaxID=1897630 RepID=UPI0009783841|nr:transporter substrate-binding domain-containing protein [Motiliproteus sp. MSK22-1]OMH38307.1 hypothetical protein BGP75_08670 [Motiliproteus sp. MSK22-1]
MMKYLAIAFFWFFSISAYATEIEKISWGTEVWKGYTDKDGSGIYTQILERIFSNAGVEINISYMPFARTLHLVKINKLDFAGGIPRDKTKAKDYIQAKYPIAVNRFVAFFHKETLDKWQGKASLEGRVIVATPHQAEQAGLEEEDVYVVETREQALQMVLNKRAAFFLDNEKVLENIIKENQSAFDPDDYRTEDVGTSGYYMIAPNTERGQAIMDIYEKGTLGLYKSGELNALYSQRGFSTPRIEE